MDFEQFKNKTKEVVGKATSKTEHAFEKGVENVKTFASDSKDNIEKAVDDIKEKIDENK